MKWAQNKNRAKEVFLAWVEQGKRRSLTHSLHLVPDLDKLCMHACLQHQRSCMALCMHILPLHSSSRKQKICRTRCAPEVRAQVLDDAVDGVAVEQQVAVVVADAVQAAQDVLLRSRSTCKALSCSKMTYALAASASITPIYADAANMIPCCTT